MNELLIELLSEGTKVERKNKEPTVSLDSSASSLTTAMTSETPFRLSIK